MVKLDTSGEEVWITDQVEDTIIKDIEVEYPTYNIEDMEEEGWPTPGLVAVGYEYSTRQEEGCSG